MFLTNRTTLTHNRDGNKGWSDRVIDIQNAVAVPSRWNGPDESNPCVAHNTTHWLWQEPPKGCLATERRPMLAVGEYIGGQGQFYSLVADCQVAGPNACVQTRYSLRLDPWYWIPNELILECGGRVADFPSILSRNVGFWHAVLLIRHAKKICNGRHWSFIQNSRIMFLIFQ
jgi:hypothetical protein